MRGLAIGFIALLAVCVVLIAYGYSEAQRDPVVRRAYVAVRDWPAGEPPRTVLLLSDTHMSTPGMPPERLERIVNQLNALHPDLILLGGDYMGHSLFGPPIYPPRVFEPLTRLRAPLGVVAVLGNHDNPHLRSVFRREFDASPITLLNNEAVRRGPFRIGGVNDLWTGPADVPRTEQALEQLGMGPTLILTHNPDVIVRMKMPVAAVLAGHTHCGQVVLPLLGPIAIRSPHHRRFACGRIEDQGRTLFVTAGLGTSFLPVRIGAPPDVWLIRFGPAR
ncbi:MAG TPA: metallophosphoesterase [Sphingobium sp.]